MEGELFKKQMGKNVKMYRGKKQEAKKVVSDALWTSRRRRRHSHHHHQLLLHTNCSRDFKCKFCRHIPHLRLRFNCLSLKADPTSRLLRISITACQ